MTSEELQEISELSRETEDGKSWSFRSMTPEGDLVVSVEARAELEAGQVRLNQARLALVDPVTGELRVVSDSPRPGPPTQIVGAASSQRWLVWSETTSTTMDAAPVQLYSYGRRSGEERNLGTVLGLAVEPTVVGDRVFVAGFDRTGNRPQHEVIYSAPADGSGRLTPFARNAAVPASDGSSLYYLQLTPDGSEVIRAEPETGTTTTVFSVEKPQSIALPVAGEGNAAWLVTSGRRAVDVYASIQGQDPRPLMEIKQFGSLAVTSRYIAVALERGGGFAPLAYLVEDDRIVCLSDDVTVNGARGHGDYATWANVSWRSVRPPSRHTTSLAPATSGHPRATRAFGIAKSTVRTSQVFPDRSATLLAASFEWPGQHLTQSRKRRSGRDPRAHA